MQTKVILKSIHFYTSHRMRMSMIGLNKPKNAGLWILKQTTFSLSFFSHVSLSLSLTNRLHFIKRELSIESLRLCVQKLKLIFEHMAFKSHTNNSIQLLACNRSAIWLEYSLRCSYFEMNMTRNNKINDVNFIITLDF